MNIIMSTIVSFSLIMAQNLFYSQSLDPVVASNAGFKGAPTQSFTSSKSPPKVQDIKDLHKFLLASADKENNFTPIPKSARNAQAAGVCDEYSPKGLCNSYCVAKKCVGSDSKSCEVLRRNADRKTGSPIFPCDGTNVITGNEVIIGMDADRERALISTPFTFTADVVGSNIDGISLAWVTSDGQTASGETAQFAFDQSGIAEVTVVGTDSSGQEIATAALSVFVFDADGNLPGFAYPERLGDADNDGDVTLADAVLVKQYANGLVLELVDPGRRNADADLDGAITEADAGLIAEMAVRNTSRPKTITSAAPARPGTRVFITSPDIMELEADYEVQVGQAAAINLVTIYPGYGTFHIPADYDPVAVDLAPYEIEILANGVAVETYQLDIAPAPEAPADVVAESIRFLNALESLAELHTAAMEDLALEADGTAEEQAFLFVVSETQLSEISPIIQEMRDLLNSPIGAGLAEQFAYHIDVNGGDEFIAEVEALVADAAFGGDIAAQRVLSPDEICDLLIPASCTVKTSAELLSKGIKILGFACDALLAVAVAAAIVPVDGPLVDAAAFAAWALKCAAIEARLKIIKVVSSLVGDLDIDLELEASTTAPTQDEPATITAKANFIGIDDLCSFGADKAYGQFEKKLTERIVGEMLRDSASLRLIQKAFQLGGERLLQRFFNLLEDAVGEVLSQTGVGSALKNLANLYCDTRTPGGLGPILPANRVLQIAEGPGSLSFNSDGTAEFMCPDPAEAGMTKIEAKKTFCDGEQVQSVSLACESKPVTITMGDNGSLNDDIFEVRIDGKTVLTSSSPVRSTSTTVQLPVGRTDVSMVGRAAPDGIGTYFIRFSGASVVGGDATSGSDLSVGVTKTFTIEVQ